MIRACVIAGLVAAISAPTLAQDPAPPTLSPVGPWALEYDDTSCALSRDFGDAEKPERLELRQYAPGTPFLGTVSSQRQPAEELKAHFRFLGTNAGSSRGASWSFEAPGGGHGVSMKVYIGGPGNGTSLASVDAERDAYEQSIEEFSIAGAFADDYILEVESMHAPLSAMRDCMIDLTSHFGLDGEAHRTLSQRAEIDNLSQSWRRIRRELPKEVYAKYYAGLLPVLIFLDETGGVTGCRRLMPLGTDAEIASLCETLSQYRKFTPAKAADGSPIKSLKVEGIYRVRTAVTGG